MQHLVHSRSGLGLLNITICPQWPRFLRLLWRPSLLEDRPRLFSISGNGQCDQDWEAFTEPLHSAPLTRTSLLTGRVRLQTGASLRIEGLRVEDQGWYECRVLFLDQHSPEQDFANGSWVHLTVNCMKLGKQVVTGGGRMMGTLVVKGMSEFCAVPMPYPSWHVLTMLAHLRLASYLCPPSHHHFIFR